jgi:hypothetical protein
MAGMWAYVATGGPFPAYASGYSGLRLYGPKASGHTGILAGMPVLMVLLVDEMAIPPGLRPEMLTITCMSTESKYRRAKPSGKALSILH